VLRTAVERCVNTENPENDSAYIALATTAPESVSVMVPPDATAAVARVAMTPPTTPLAAVACVPLKVNTVYVLPPESAHEPVGVEADRLSADQWTTTRSPMAMAAVVVITSVVPEVTLPLLPNAVLNVMATAPS
jgi:hypothetical protein